MAKPSRIISRRRVLRQLGVPGDVLDRLEELQLLVPVRRPGKERGYTFEDLDHLRVYRLLVWELGVNDAGAEIILQMRHRLLTLQRRLFAVLSGVHSQDLIEEIRAILAELDERG